MACTVYVLQSLKDDTFYIGVTTDLEERLLRHNEGRSVYTRRRRPWKLIYSEEQPDKSAAMKRESYLKSIRNPEFLLRLTEQKQKHKGP
ncbi:GIY-YIG nuclease family protein [candidate division KSB1 bacterium]